MLIYAYFIAFLAKKKGIESVQIYHSNSIKITKYYLQYILSYITQYTTKLIPTSSMA